MKLTTARLTIEPLAERDIPDFVAYRQRPEIARYQSWSPDFASRDAQELVASNPAELPPLDGWVQLAMHHDGRLVGDLAVHTLAVGYELGVTVGEQRQGYATEGMSALVAHLSPSPLFAFSDSRNDAVAALLTRVGFVRDGQEPDFFKGEWTTLDGWTLLPD
ncbi:MAG: putative acetyltransferase [Microbacteriaceae bacterium]|nr:putative acetyltransferase [Microbacteriaceae bacterium]